MEKEFEKEVGEGGGRKCRVFRVESRDAAGATKDRILDFITNQLLATCQTQLHTIHEDINNMFRYAYALTHPE